jgi:hypothetical protein
MVLSASVPSAALDLHLTNVLLRAACAVEAS